MNGRVIESKSPVLTDETLISQVPGLVTSKPYAPDGVVTVDATDCPASVRSSTWSPGAADASRRTSPRTLGAGTRGPAPSCTLTPQPVSCNASGQARSAIRDRRK